ncbi:MAG: hypothetical protein K6G88_09550 [Lachnospiraceae bacterium]|nr:hypothetical protein [Lachnospiraceae bacterium]
MKNFYQKDEFILSNIFGAVCITGGLLLIKIDIILPILLILLGMYYLILIWGIKQYASKPDNRIADFFNYLASINYYILATFGALILIVALLKNMPAMISVSKNHHWVAFAIIIVGILIVCAIRFILFGNYSFAKAPDKSSRSSRTTQSSARRARTGRNTSSADSNKSHNKSQDSLHEDDSTNNSNSVYEDDSMYEDDSLYADDSLYEGDSLYDDNSMSDDASYEYADNESVANVVDYSSHREELAEMNSSIEAAISNDAVDVDEAIGNLFDDYDVNADTSENDGSADITPSQITEDLVESSDSEAAKAIRRIRENVSSPSQYLARKKSSSATTKEYADDINVGQVEIPYYLKKKLISYCPDCGATLEGDFLLCENCGGVMRQKHVDIE